jgi:hypothetical protein
MGNLGHDLSSALGSAASSIGSVIGGATGQSPMAAQIAAANNYDPGLPATGNPLADLYPQGYQDLAAMGAQGGQPQDQGQGQQPDASVPMPTQGQGQTAQSYQAPDNPAVADTPKELSAAITADPNDVTVTGFSPHKESVLAQIGDFFLGGRFKDVNDRRNLRSAMEGFTSDPLGTIQKVSTFNPQLAWKMFDNYQQLHKNDQEDAAKLVGLQDQVWSGVGNTLNAIGTSTKDHDAQYQKMLPYLQRKLEAAGIDPANLPSKWDDDVMSGIASGGYKVKDQESQKALDAYRKQSLGLRAADVQSEIGTREAGVGLRATEVNNQIQHDRTMEGISQDQANRTAANDGENLMDKDGNVIGQYKKGQALLTAPGGARYVFSATRDKQGRVRLGVMLSGPQPTRNNGVITVSPNQ